MNGRSCTLGWSRSPKSSAWLYLQENWKSAAHSSSTGLGSEDPPSSESSNPSQVTGREQEVVSQSSAKSSLHCCFQHSKFWRFLPEPSAPEGERFPGCSCHPQQPQLGAPARAQPISKAHRARATGKCPCWAGPGEAGPAGSRAAEQSWQQATQHGNAKDRHEMHQILTLCSVFNEFCLRFGWQDLPVKCWMPPALLLGASFLHVAAGV